MVGADGPLAGSTLPPARGQCHAMQREESSRQGPPRGHDVQQGLQLPGRRMGGTRVLQPLPLPSGTAPSQARMRSWAGGWTPGPVRCQSTPMPSALQSSSNFESLLRPGLLQSMDGHTFPAWVKMSECGANQLPMRAGQPEGDSDRAKEEPPAVGGWKLELAEMHARGGTGPWGSRSAIPTEVQVSEASAIQWQKQHPQAVTRYSKRTEQLQEARPAAASAQVEKTADGSPWLGGSSHGSSSAEPVLVREFTQGQVMQTRSHSPGRSKGGVEVQGEESAAEWRVGGRHEGAGVQCGGLGEEGQAAEREQQTRRTEGRGWSPGACVCCRWLCRCSVGWGHGKGFMVRVGQAQLTARPAARHPRCDVSGSVRPHRPTPGGR